jgi:hypothetical protein
MSNATHCVNEFVNSAGLVGLVGRKVLICINRRAEMPPPLIYRPLRAQLEQLREQTQVGAKPEPVAPQRSKQIVDEYTSSILTWKDQATPIQRLRLFTIDELIRLANLSGRFRAQASHRYTGEALRRCGFKQKRDWTASGRNKRFWLLDGEAQ